MYSDSGSHLLLPRGSSDTDISLVGFLKRGGTRQLFVRRSEELVTGIFFLQSPSRECRCSPTTSPENPQFGKLSGGIPGEGSHTEGGRLTISSSASCTFYNYLLLRQQYPVVSTIVSAGVRSL